MLDFCGARGSVLRVDNAADDSPCQLAAKFVKRFPAVVEDGKGSDPDYARWYADMIEATEPEGLIYMYADWELPSDHIPVLNMDGMDSSPAARNNQRREFSRMSSTEPAVAADRAGITGRSGTISRRTSRRPSEKSPR